MTDPRSTERTHATMISFHYAEEENNPADTDGQYYTSLASLRRNGNARPVNGRWAEITLSNGDTYELDADGSDWAIDGDTSRGYETLADAVDQLEVIANES